MPISSCQNLLEQIQSRMPIEIASVVCNVSYPIPGSTHSENSPACYCTIWGIYRMLMAVLVCIASNSIWIQWLQMKQNANNWTQDVAQKQNPYDKLIGVQPANCPVPVSMCDNIFACHPGNKFAANSHGPCCTFVFPKIVPPTVRWGIYAELVRVWLKNICKSQIPSPFSAHKIAQLFHTFVFLLFQRFKYAFNTSLTAKLITAPIIPASRQTFRVLFTVRRKEFKL